MNVLSRAQQLHQHRNGSTHISYNVAVEVDLHTIIEEELHAQIADLHQSACMCGLNFLSTCREDKNQDNEKNKIRIV